MYDHHLSGNTRYKGYTLFIKEKKEISLPSAIAGIGFVKKGDIYISGGEIDEKKIEEGNIILFPPGMVCSVCSPSGASVFIFEVPEIISFCHQFLANSFFDSTVEKEEYFFSLPFHLHIEKVATVTEEYIRRGFIDSALLQIKIQECFYLITTCYIEDLLRKFLSPVLSPKYRFTHFVLSYYTSVKTVEELARLSSYSLSGFDKEFRKAFGMAPYKWMLQKKTQSIYRDINETSKPLKLIAEEYDFDTPSGLTDFCRRHLGLCPSAIRKKRGSREMTN